MDKIKIAFDIGGVLSKYPEQFRMLYDILSASPLAEVFVISDMHPLDKMLIMLHDNGFQIDYRHIFSADYETHGEACKAVLCEELGIDMLIDDFIGYLSDGHHVRLLVMPDSSKSYYAESWVTDGSEGDFGRRKKSDAV